MQTILNLQKLEAPSAVGTFGDSSGSSLFKCCNDPEDP